MTLEEFAARKAADALGARMSGFTTELDRAPAGMVTIETPWTRQLFDGPFHLSPVPAARYPGCSLVFVQSREGNTGAADPSTLGGGDTDKHLIYEGLSRVAADAVMAGAETIRGANLVFSVWHPQLVALRAALGKPRHPAQIVATLRGLEIERSLLFNVPSIPVFLVTVGLCVDVMRNALASRPWITPIVLPGQGGLRAGFAQLRDAGIERISCIGGRSIASQLLDAALVQDVYLTTSRISAGQPGTPFYAKPLAMDVIVRKHGRDGENGVVFEHLMAFTSVRTAAARCE